MIRVQFEVKLIKVKHEEGKAETERKRERKKMLIMPR